MSLELNAAGYHCQSSDLYQVLLRAVVPRGTIKAVCAAWIDAPMGNTVRGYLKEQICAEDLSDLAARLNRALVVDLPPRLWRKPRVWAMEKPSRKTDCGFVVAPSKVSRAFTALRQFT